MPRRQFVELEIVDLDRPVRRFVRRPQQGGLVLVQDARRYRIGDGIAVEPAFRSGSWVTATVYGALFGFFVYATYDLTNLAMLKQWPVSVAALDIAWGTFVNAVAATAGFLAARAFAGE